MSLYDLLLAARSGMAGRIKKGGSYYMIPCPFHGSGDERTPSCSVAIAKPVYYCHACGASGHVTAVLRKLGMSKEAASRAVERPGTFSGNQRGVVDPGQIKNRLRPPRDPHKGFVLSEDVLDDFRRAPVDLIEAGFRKNTLMHFEVGFDKKNFRTTYPIRNLYGDLVGVSGRAYLKGMTPRYKIYDREYIDLSADKDWAPPRGYTMDGVKKYLLWHSHVVSPFLMTGDHPLILSEGFKACMWTYQAGYKASVALIGARMSHAQANMISRITQDVVLFLDNNEAGWFGTYHAARLLTKMRVRVKVARYPDGRGQPDDLDPDETVEAIANPVRFLDWRSVYMKNHKEKRTDQHG